MRESKFIVAGVLFLLIGCSEVKNSADQQTINFLHKNLKDICCISTHDNYFTSPAINIRNTVAEIKKQNNVDFYYDFVNDEWVCTSIDNETHSKIKASCKYLGTWHGQDLIFRRWNGDFSGHFTDILLCSVKNGNLNIHKQLLQGDRALDGIVSTPIFDGKNSIYFYCNLSTATFKNLKGIKERDNTFQGAQDFWNVSKCVYNLETNKLEIIEVTITSKDYSKIFKIKS